MLNWGHFCTSWDIFVKKWKIWKKLKILKVRSDCDSTLKILLETGLNLKFHANLKKYEKLHDVSMKHFFVKKWKFWKKILTFQNRSDCDSTLKILLETGLNLKFHENLKQYEKLHDVSICTSWNIFVSWTKRAWELYESSRRKPGWRFTAGCKSYIFWDFFVISEKFCLRNLMKPRAFYIIRL